MSKRVWKFPVIADGRPSIHKMPEGTRILHVADQDGTPTMWACVYDALPEAAEDERMFIVSGTGHDVPAGAVYVGTAVGVPFVWHVWEIDRG